MVVVEAGPLNGYATFHMVAANSSFERPATNSVPSAYPRSVMASERSEVFFQSTFLLSSIGFGSATFAKGTEDRSTTSGVPAASKRTSTVASATSFASSHCSFQAPRPRDTDR